VEVIVDGLEVNSIVIGHIHVLGAFSEREIGDDIACRGFEGQARMPWSSGSCSVIKSLQDSVQAVDDDRIQFSNILLGKVWIDCCAALAMKIVRLSGNQ
jgi:hypothetical protein